MAIYESISVPHQSGIYIPEGMGDIRFPYTDGREISISIGTQNDPHFTTARLFEHETFVELGDRPAAFPSADDHEFQPYDSVSAITYAHVVPAGSELTDDAALVGMNRFIPWTVDHGNKTVTDLASIPVETIDSDTREKVLTALLGVGNADVLEDDLLKSSLERVILDRMCRDNGSCDPRAVVDVATLAPDIHLGHTERFSVASALLGATAMYILRAQADQRFTHFTQFTERGFSILMKKLGYPSEPIAGLKNVLYDTKGDGIAMVANPQVTDITDLRRAFEAAAPDTHLGNIAAIYKRRFA